MPWSLRFDQIRFAGSDRGFYERVIERVTDRSDRRGDVRVDKMLDEPERSVLTSGIRMMYKLEITVEPAIFSIAYSHLDRVQHEIGFLRHARFPADDFAGERIDGEGRVDGAGPAGHVGEVRDP